MANKQDTKRTYYKCKKCKDEIFYDTCKKMIYCKCKAIAIDGCDDYVRVMGDKNDYEVIEK